VVELRKLGIRGPMDPDLLDFLKQSFSAIDERFVAMEANVAQQIKALRQETAERFDKVDQRFGNLETEVRQVHVVVEDLRDKIQLTAEGIMNVDEKLDRHKEEVDKRFNDLESLVRTSDRGLSSRVSKLERKVKLAM
jgi:predicted phage gp36 major capsid-like protein